MWSRCAAVLVLRGALWAAALAQGGPPHAFNVSELNRGMDPYMPWRIVPVSELNASLGGAPRFLDTRRANPHYDHIFYDPAEAHIKYELVGEHVIYFVHQTNKRLEDLQPILLKYSNQIYYRIGFIFSKLENLLMDINRIGTIVHKNTETYYVHQMIHFYEHAMRKNVDVTYIIEYLIDQHTRTMEGADTGIGENTRRKLGGANASLTAAGDSA